MLLWRKRDNHFRQQKNSGRIVEREREREREENLSVEEAISLGKFYEPTVLLAGQCLF
jgi:hypothetical protein